eukprot:scaffold85080_cov31-Tisochrysis_lutea.AAC.5
MLAVARCGGEGGGGGEGSERAPRGRKPRRLRSKTRRIAGGGGGNRTGGARRGGRERKKERAVGKTRQGPPEGIPKMGPCYTCECLASPLPTGQGWYFSSTSSYCSPTIESTTNMSAPVLLHTIIIP